MVLHGIDHTAQQNSAAAREASIPANWTDADHDLWNRGYQPVHTTRNAQGVWTPEVGTTGSAPFAAYPRPEGRGEVKLAYRTPPGVVALDVDDGRDGKSGWDTLTRFEAERGALPQTVRLTSRGPDQRSGHLLYRLPEGYAVSDGLFTPYGGCIDVLRLKHRWGWAPGTLHPKTGAPVAVYSANDLSTTLPHAVVLPLLTTQQCEPAAAPMASPVGQPVQVARGAAEHSTAKALEEFRAAVPLTTSLRSALLRWASLRAKFLRAEGESREDIEQDLWDEVHRHPCWGHPDWEDGPTEGAIASALGYAATEPIELVADVWELILGKGEAPMAPGVELPRPAGHDAGKIDPFPFTDPEEFDNPTPAPRAEHGAFGGSVPLFYADGVHWLQGESESGKTWVALALVAEHLAAEHAVLMIDYEDTRSTVLRRLRLLGVTAAQARRFVYVGGHDHEFAALAQHVASSTERDYRLMVVDGVTSALNAAGCSQNDAAEVTRWVDALPRRAQAAICIDHVVKSSDDRRGMAIGSQAKKAVVTGTAWEVVCTARFGQGFSGAILLRLQKDKPGGVRGALASQPVQLLVTCERDSVRLTAPETAAAAFLSPATGGPAALFGQLYAAGLRADTGQAELLRRVKALGGGYSTNRKAEVHGQWAQFCTEQAATLSNPFNSAE